MTTWSTSLKLLVRAMVMIALGKKVRPVDLGTRVGFCDIGATVAELLGAQLDTPGRSFARELL